MLHDGTPAVASRALGAGTLQRLGLLVAAAAVLAAIDLDVKLNVTTPPWAYHHRPGSWFVICAVTLLGAVALARVPSRSVAVAAGIMSGGILGNVISARWHGDAVPNPIVLGNQYGGVAFNVADVFTLVGIMLLTGALLAVTIRNRAKLWRPRHGLDRWLNDRLDR